MNPPMTSSPPLPAAAVSSDASLLAAARHDPNAFRELYERYAEVVHDYVVRRAGVVVLSASFDPGWTATVDGHRQRTEMVSPALVATTVPAGTHRVVFRYRGLPYYPLLFSLCAATLLALAWADIRRARSAGRRNLARPGAAQ